MANTATIDRKLGIINIVPDGAADFDLAASFPEFAKGVFLDSIGFGASAANDQLRICEATDAGVDIMPPMKSITGGPMEKEFFDDRLYKPYMDMTDCVFGTPANVLIVIKFKPGMSGM